MNYIPLVKQKEIPLTSYHLDEFLVVNIEIHIYTCFHGEL